MHPVQRRRDERGEHDEAESMRAVAAARLRLSENFHAQDPQEPQRGAEQNSANRAVDDGHRRQPSRGDVHLRIEEIQQVRDVQAEDRPGQHAFEIRPAESHPTGVYW